MQQFIRNVRLTAEGGKFVAASDGNGLCIRFEVQQAVCGTPAHAIIMLMNTSRQTKVPFYEEQYIKVELVDADVFAAKTNLDSRHNNFLSNGSTPAQPEQPT